MKFVDLGAWLFCGFLVGASAAGAQDNVKPEAQAVQAAREKALREADELIKSNQPAQALVLLQALEFERAGEVPFDLSLIHISEPTRPY